MNYQRAYDTLMVRAKDRELDGYYEKHHIIPRCLGGVDDVSNIAKLTPEEHYIAHQLLVKIYPDNISLVYAAHMMGSTRKNNKVYGWLRRKLVESTTGIPKSAETRENMSKAKKGRPATGKPFKTGQVATGTPYQEGNIPWNKGKTHMAGKDNPAYGKTWNTEKRNKMSFTNKGRKKVTRDDGTWYYIYPHLENKVLP